jgi:hypothetical protein
VLDENGYIVAYPASGQSLVFLPDGLFNARAWNMRESFGEAVDHVVDGFRFVVHVHVLSFLPTALPGQEAIASYDSGCWGISWACLRSGAFERGRRRAGRSSKSKKPSEHLLPVQGFRPELRPGEEELCLGVGSALFFDGVKTPVAESVRPFRRSPRA